MSRRGETTTDKQESFSVKMTRHNHLQDVALRDLYDDWDQPYVISAVSEHLKES